MSAPVSPEVLEAAEDSDSGFFFKRLGEVSFTSGEELSSLPPLAGCQGLQTLAVANYFGITLFIDPRGFYAVLTEKILEKIQKAEDGGVLEPTSISDIGGIFVPGHYSSLSLSPDQQTIAVVSTNGQVAFHHLHSLMEKHRSQPFLTHTAGDAVRQVLWNLASPSRYSMLTASGTLLLGSTGKQEMKELSSAVDAAAWSPDGAMLALAKGQHLEVVRAQDLGMVAKIRLSCPEAEEDRVELSIDTVHWVKPATIIVGTSMVEEDEEEGRAPMFVVQWPASQGPSACSVYEFQAYPSAEVDVAPTSCGPYLHTCYFAPWGVALAAHRKSCDQHVKLIGLSEDSGAVEIMVDDDWTAIRLPLGADDEDNYVLGMGLDTCAGAKVEVNHPTSEEGQPLPACPVLLLSTSDGRLRLFTFGSIKTRESAAKARQDLPEPKAASVTDETQELDKLKRAAGADLPDGSDDDFDSSESEADEVKVPAQTGWGSGFMAANQANAAAATDAAGKAVEEAKGGAPKPAASAEEAKISFGASPAGGSAPAFGGGSSFGAAPQPAASGWGSGFMAANQANAAAATEAAEKAVEDAKGGGPKPAASGEAAKISFGVPPAGGSAPAFGGGVSFGAAPQPAVSGWGSGFMAANQANAAAATDAAEKAVEEAKGGAPKPAASGWGSGFMDANQASTAAATDAAEKVVEEAKGGAPKPAASTEAAKISFGVPPAGGPVPTFGGGSSFGAAPQPAASGWGSGFMAANQANAAAATEAAEKAVEDAKGVAPKPAASGEAAKISFGVPPAGGSAPAFGGGVSFGAAPHPAASGWGSGFMAANQANAAAATEAAEKVVEEAKGGGPKPAASTEAAKISFGVAATGGSAPAFGGGVSFGAAPQPAVSGCGSGFMTANQANAAAATEAAEKVVEEAKGGGSKPAASGEAAKISFGVAATGGSAPAFGGGVSFGAAPQPAASGEAAKISFGVPSAGGSAPAFGGGVSFGAAPQPAASGLSVPPASAASQKPCAVTSPAVSPASENSNSEFFFKRLGEVCFSTQSVALPASDLQDSCGLQTLAVSNMYGITLLTVSKGLYAAFTEKILQKCQKAEEGRIWSALGGPDLRMIRSALEPTSISDIGGIFVPGHYSSLSLSPDQQTIAVVSTNGQVAFHHLNSLMKKHSTQPFLTQTAGDAVRQVLWNPASPSSYSMLTASGTLLLGSTGKQEMKELSSAVDAAAWSPDGAMLALAKGQHLEVVRAQDLGMVAKIRLSCPEAEEDRVELSIDTVHWVKPATIIVGTSMVEEDEEEGRAPMFVVQWPASQGPSACSVYEFQAYPSAEVDVAPTSCGPYLHTCYFAPWGVALAAHRKSCDQHVKLIGLSEDSGAVEIMVDDDRTAIRLPLGADDEDNYVLGMGLDTCAGAKVEVYHPTSEERQALQGCPLLLLMTSDGRLRIFTFGSTTATALSVLAMVRQELPETAPQSAIQQSPVEAVARSEPEAPKTFVPPATSAANVKPGVMDSANPKESIAFRVAVNTPLIPPVSFGAAQACNTAMSADFQAQTSFGQQQRLPEPQYSEGRSKLQPYALQPPTAFKPVAGFASSAASGPPSVDSSGLDPKLGTQDQNVALMERDFLKVLLTMREHEAEVDRMMENFNAEGLVKLQNATAALSAVVQEELSDFKTQREMVSKLDGTLPRSCAVESLGARLLAASDESDLQCSLPLEPPLASLQRQIEHRVHEIAETASELESVLQAEEDRMLDGEIKRKTPGRSGPVSVSHNSIYSSLNNMSTHANQQAASMQRLLHQVEQLSISMEVGDLGSFSSPAHKTPSRSTPLRRLMYSPAAQSATSQGPRSGSPLQSPWQPSSTKSIVQALQRSTRKCGSVRVTEACAARMALPGSATRGSSASPTPAVPQSASRVQVKSSMSTTAAPQQQAKAPQRPAGGLAQSTVPTGTTAYTAYGSNRTASASSTDPQSNTYKFGQQAPAMSATTFAASSLPKPTTLSFSPAGQNGGPPVPSAAQMAAAQARFASVPAATSSAASAKRAAPKSSGPPVPSAAQMAAAQAKFSSVPRAASSAAPAKPAAPTSGGPPVPSAAQMAAAQARFASAPGTASSAAPAKPAAPKSSGPPVPSAAQMAAAQAKFASVPGAASSASPTKPAAPKSSGPPVPSAAQMAAAQAKFASVPGAASSAASSKPAAPKSSGPPVPSAAQMAAAQAKFASVPGAASSAAPAKPAAPKSSGPPVPSAAQMAAAQAKFASVPGATSTSAPAQATSGSSQSSIPSAFSAQPGNGIWPRAKGFAAAASQQPASSELPESAGVATVFSTSQGLFSALSQGTSPSSAPAFGTSAPSSAFGGQTTASASSCAATSSFFGFCQATGTGAASQPAASSPFSFATAAASQASFGAPVASSGGAPLSFGSMGLGATPASGPAPSPFGQGLAFGSSTAPSAAAPAKVPAFGSPGFSSFGVAQPTSPAAGFGSNSSTPTSAFVSSGAAAAGSQSPFGGVQSAFGAPSAMGANAAGGSFGKPTAFGQSAFAAAPPASGFGQPPAPGFGTAAQTGQPGFGQTAAPGAGFGQASAFGQPSAQPASAPAAFGQAASGGSSFGAFASKPAAFGGAGAQGSGFSQFASPGAGGAGGFRGFASNAGGGGGGFGAFGGGSSFGGTPAANTSSPGGDKWAMRK